jgi:membrane protein YqaA with SNARE-associated domain
MLKNLYDKCVELARHKFSKPLLGFVAFVESFFFPVPPDLMIVPMVVAKKEDYLKIFLIATIFSVLGALFGYLLGAFFLDISMAVIEFYGYQEKVFAIQDKMSTKGGFFLWLGIMFLAGFTPLPFKVFTITSGIISFNIFVFFFICLFTRGLRFFIVSYLTYRFGYKFADFLQKKGALWFTLTGLFVAIIGSIIYFLLKNYEIH